MPTATGWTVDGALDEVVAAIEAGAFLLALDPSTKTALRARFHADFDREHKAGTDWPQEKRKVLRLANMVGAYAEACSITKSTNPASVLNKGKLNPTCVLWAAEFVAKFLCPSASSGPVVYGKWCRGFRRLKPSRLESKLVAAADLLAAQHRGGASASKRASSDPTSARKAAPRSKRPR